MRDSKYIYHVTPVSGSVAVMFMFLCDLRIDNLEKSRDSKKIGFRIVFNYSYSCFKYITVPDHSVNSALSTSLYLSTVDTVFDHSMCVVLS